MNHRPAVLTLNPGAAGLDATVRPHDRLDLVSGVFGIFLAIGALAFSRELVPPGWPVHAVQVVAALAFAVMVRRLVYYAAGFVDVRADRDGLRLVYPNLGVRKTLAARGLTPVRLKDDEGSPLAGINLGPLSGSLWCEAEGRYVSFGRGLNEEDAKRLAEAINAALAKQ